MPNYVMSHKLQIMSRLTNIRKHNAQCYIKRASHNNPMYPTLYLVLFKHTNYILCLEN